MIKEKEASKEWYELENQYCIVERYTVRILLNECRYNECCGQNGSGPRAFHEGTTLVLSEISDEWQLG